MSCTFAKSPYLNGHPLWPTFVVGTFVTLTSHFTKLPLPPPTHLDLSHTQPFILCSHISFYYLESPFLLPALPPRTLYHSSQQVRCSILSILSRVIIRLCPHSCPAPPVDAPTCSQYSSYITSGPMYRFNCPTQPKKRRTIPLLWNRFITYKGRR